MVKRCNKCNELKNVCLFNKNKSKKDGYQQYCRKCDNEAQRKRYKKNKEYYINKNHTHRNKLKEYVNNIKKQGCSNCDESDISCIDFHHIENKKENISKLVNDMVSINVLKNEISKCILLCANCHRKLHYQE